MESIPQNAGGENLSPYSLINEKVELLPFFFGHEYHYFRC